MSIVKPLALFSMMWAVNFGALRYRFPFGELEKHTPTHTQVARSGAESILLSIRLLSAAGFSLCVLLSEIQKMTQSRFLHGGINTTRLDFAGPHSTPAVEMGW